MDSMPMEPPECARPATKRARPAVPPPLRAPLKAAGMEEDRLSALDDGTLHDILARVPLRDAAATTVLSRRWPRVFATLPRLRLRAATFNRRDFPDEGHQDYCEDPLRWLDALSRVLDGRAAPVAAFDLDFKYMGLYDDYFAGVFAEICGSGSLLELSLVNTKFTECYHLPAPIYRCATLTSLDLFNWRVKVPGRITGLRALRLLRLRCVTASDDDLRRLITRCSSVERLEIVNVYKARSIVINAPRLEKLLISSHRPLRVSVKKAPRLDAVKLNFSYSHPEGSWSRNDTMDSDFDYSFSEIDEMLDYKKMAKREHERTDEIGNMVTFLSGLGSAKKLHLSPDIPKGSSEKMLADAYGWSDAEDSDHYDEWNFEVFSRGKASMPKVLPKRRCLFGLEKLSLDMDHNHEVFATLVSCLLNNSPNLKDLRIDSCHSRTSHVPLPAEYWKENINADAVLNHLSSVTFLINSIFEGGFCQFLVMNAKALKKISIMYYRREVKAEDATKLEAICREIQLQPRASPDLRLELCPLDHYQSFTSDFD